MNRTIRRIGASALSERGWPTPRCVPACSANIEQISKIATTNVTIDIFHGVTSHSKANRSLLPSIHVLSGKTRRVRRWSIGFALDGRLAHHDLRWHRSVGEPAPVAPRADPSCAGCLAGTTRSSLQWPVLPTCPGSSESKFRFEVAGLFIQDKANGECVERYPSFQGNPSFHGKGTCRDGARHGHWVIEENGRIKKENTVAAENTESGSFYIKPPTLAKLETSSMVYGKGAGLFGGTRLATKKRDPTLTDDATDIGLSELHMATTLEVGYVSGDRQGQ